MNRYRRYWLTFIFIPTVVFSNEIQVEDDRQYPTQVQKDIPRQINEYCSGTLSNFETEPSAIVGGVNVITGDYLEHSCDLVIPGPEPIILERFYCSTDSTQGNLSEGWNHNLFGYFAYDDKSRGVAMYQGTLITSYGATLPFLLKNMEKNKLFLSIDHSTIKHGLTNCGSGEISGRTNRNNMLISHVIDSDESYLRSGSGSIAYYKWDKKIKKKPGQFLRWERKPNGNEIRYQYDTEGHLKSVETCNKSGETFAWLKFKQKTTKKLEEWPWIDVSTSDGRKLRYCFNSPKIGSKKDKRSLLVVSERPNDTHEAYYYSVIDDREMITWKSTTDKNFLATEYYTEKVHEVGGRKVFLDKHDERYNRVRVQYAPLGSDGSKVILRQFLYHLGPKSTKKMKSDSSTEVLDALNHCSYYHYSDEHRLTAVEWKSGTLRGQYQPYRTEYLSWGPKGTVNEARLMARGMADSCTSQWIAGKALTYDERGNILKESIFGDLTGNGCSLIQLNSNGVPIENGCEHCDVNYRYSNDPLNLLIEESYPDGKRITYTYVVGTDLLSAKYIWGGDSIIIREFYEYNKDAIAIKKVIDDGSRINESDLTGVSERRIRYTKTKGDMPCRGMPTEVVEKYLDLGSGKEVLLSKVQNEYDSIGHLINETHYDANEKFLYILTWKYDNNGNVIEETDPFGNITTKQYDGGNNLIFKKGLQKDIQELYTYDYSQRLVKSEIILSDGKSYNTTHRYDYLGNRVATVDVHGNLTENRYDDFNRLIEVKLPPIETDSGKVFQPIRRYQYDLLDNRTVEIEPDGTITKRTFNIRGKPTHVTYPDGSSESYSYDISGRLIRSISQTGVSTIYAYDPLGRIIKTEKISPEGQLLSSTTSTYNAFHLIQETDEGGVVTGYTYDGAGRLVEKTIAEMRTTYQYDPQGRQNETRDWTSDTTYIAKIVDYDLIGQILEERTEDEKGTIYLKKQYQYDITGNRIAEISFRQAGESVTRSEYDPQNRLTSITDPLGNKTICEYLEVVNKLGQRVDSQMTTDAQGQQLIEEYDAHGRIVETRRKDPFGKTIQQRNVYFDEGNNPTRVEDHVFPTDRIVTTKRQFDSCHRLLELVLAYNTPEQKIIRFQYNRAGQKKLTVKADGVRLEYAYDYLGRMINVRSSDRTIDYDYTYDRGGNVVETEDKVHCTSTYRGYDSHHQLVEETLANGLKVQYTFDNIRRPLSIRHADRQVIYKYLGPQLSTIDCLSKDGQLLYSQIYDRFDLSGALEECTLPLKKGKITYRYDLSGRLTDQLSEPFQETDIQYDNVGNLISRTTTDPLGTVTNVYAYDELYQLSSEDGNVHHRFVWDALYNRIDKDDAVFEYNALNQLATSEIQYDRNGNIIQNKDTTFTYDAFDRLTRVESPQFSIIYIYDEQNRRLIQKVGSLSGDEFKTLNESRFIYQGNNEVGHFDGNNELASFRVLGIGKGAEIGASIAIEVEGRTYVPVHDQGGNIVHLFDGETYRFSAFGEQTEPPLQDGEQRECISPWRYSSKRHDSETGLVYFGRRYYDVLLGRWLTPDPSGECDSPNLYAYVLNSPMTNFDMYGLLTQYKHKCDFSNFQFPGRNLDPCFLHRAFNKVGKAIQWIGDNLVPVPVACEVVSVLGWTLGGGAPQTYIPSYSRIHSYHFTRGNGEKILGHRVLMINGIMTDEEVAIARVNAASVKLKGQNVHGVYVARHGFSFDMIDWLLNRIGFMTHSAKVTLDVLRALSNEVGPNGAIDVAAHSKGAEIINNVGSELDVWITDIMSVNTFGSPKTISADSFGKVKNYISNRDGVPMIGNPLGYCGAKAYGGGHIEFIKSDGMPFMDHSWEEDAYITAFDKFIENLNWIRKNQK